MDGVESCILLIFAAIVIAAWVFTIASNARLSRRIELLSREVLGLSRRVEDAERRAEAARSASAVAATTVPAPTSPLSPTAQAQRGPEPPPLPDDTTPSRAEARTPPHASPRAATAPSAARSVSPPPPVAAPDSSPETLPEAPLATPPAALRVPRDAAPGEIALPPSGRPAPESVEAFVGGRVLLVVGVIAVLFAIGYFMKYAIERGWVSPERRVVIGALAGVASLVAGGRMRARGYNVFGQALMGLGLGALFLCDWFACVRYGFFGRPFAFGIAALLGASGALLAIRSEAPVLAWLGFLGAFLAPRLLGTGEDALEQLALWLVLVDAGIATVLARRAWQGLDVLAAIGTMAYFLDWRVAHFRDERLGAASVCLGICVGVVLLTAFVPAALARRRIAPPSFVAAALTAVIGYAAAYDLLFPGDRAAFGAVSIGFAVLLAALAEMHRVRVPDAGADVESIRAFALAVLGAAVPVIFRGTGVAPAWAALGAACVHAGTRVRRDWLVTAGFVGISLASLDALIDRAALGGGEPVFGGAFVSALTPCIAFAVAAWSLRRRSADTVPGADVSLVAASWATVALLAQETWRAFSRDATDDSRMPALLATTCTVAVFAVVTAVLTRRREGLGTLPAWGPLLLVAALGIAVLETGLGRGFTPVVNERFVAGALVVLSLAAAASMGPRPRDLAAVPAAVHLFALVTSEIVAWGGRGGTPELTGAARDFRVHVLLWLAWTAYGALCAELGVRLRRTWLVGFGIVATLLAAGDALFARLTVAAPPFGAEFLLALVPFAGLVACAWWLRRDAVPPSGERASADAPHGATGISIQGTAPAATPPGTELPAYFGVGYLFVLVTIEILAWGDRGDADGTTRADLRFQAQVALSVFWAMYGAALVATGFWRRLTALRWTGIGVLLLTVAKVFFVDLAQLDTAYRVGSFLALGLLLVGASFLYQRLRREGAPIQEPESP